MIQTSAEPFVHENDTDTLPIWGSLVGRLFTLLPFNKIWPHRWPRGWCFDLARRVRSRLREFQRLWRVFPSSRDGAGRSALLQSWITEEFCWMLEDVLADKCDGWRVKCGGTQNLVSVRAVVCSQPNPRLENSERFYSWNIHMTELHLILASASEWKIPSHGAPPHG